MRVSFLWRLSSTFLRPGNSSGLLPASFWDSVHEYKTMKILLPGGRDAFWNLHGSRVNYSGAVEGIACNNRMRISGKGRELAHKMMPVAISRPHSIGGTKNRVIMVANGSCELSSGQQKPFWTPGGGWLSFHHCGGFSSRTVAEHGRSTGIRISATKSTVAQDEEIDEELEDEMADDDEDDDFWEDDAYPQEPEVGDGEDGGGIVLDDAEWGRAALTLALETLEKNFSSNFSLFGFKILKNSGLIRVRLDNMTDKYGSPTLDDIERFSSIYGKVLEEEGVARRLPENLALEVSSPGAERVVRVPQDLERFKELPMYVRYTVEGGAENDVKDGIWQVDRVEGDKAVWKLANVRANREVAGKGRPLNKKQKEWRLELPFSHTQLVRLYLDI